MESTRISGAEPDEANLAALMLELEEGEQPRVSCRPTIVKSTEGDFLDVRVPTILITNRRVLVSKDKLFGKPKLNWQMDLEQVDTFGFGPLNGAGPAWEAHLHSVSGNPAIFIFDGPQQAEAFRDAVREAGVEALHAQGDSTSSEGLLSQQDQVRFRLLHGFLDEVRRFSEPDFIGRPFGEGSDLELAIGVLDSHFTNIHDVRWATRIMITDLVVEAADSRLEDPSNDVLRAMGADPSALANPDLDESVRLAVRSLAGAALVLIQEIDEAGGTRDLWAQNDEVAKEMACWFSVARLRMASGGLMSPVERPDWF